MTLQSGMRWAVALTLSSSLAAFSLSGIAGIPSDKNEKPKPQVTQDIDSGSFGIFIKGQRVATETFNIEQQDRHQHHQVAR